MAQTIVNQIVEKLKSDNAKNVCAFDLQGKTNVAKFIILSSFASEEDCKNASGEILFLLKELKVEPYNLEGLNKGSWIVIDLKDIIVHILTNKEREKYNLEKLYKDCKKIM